MPFLFTSGTARGGTNLRTFMLDRHPKISMAIDPFIPLFRYYRDSILRSVGRDDLVYKVSSGALDDYYFSHEKIEVMNLIQDSDPDIPFEMAGWPDVRNSLLSRMSLTSKNLIKHLDNLPAATFKEVFNNCLTAVASRKNEHLDWVGFNENWAAEFFPLLARLFPDAKFILHLRDPRAVVNSSEFAEPDIRKRPTILSFSRHIRKYIALSYSFTKNPLFKNRLLITQYEPFLVDPERQIKRVLDFLGLTYCSEMLEIHKFQSGDGSLVNTPWEIYKASGDIWRKEMPRDMLELVEFICSPDMRLLGYEPECYDDKRGLSNSALKFAVDNVHNCLGWSTDLPLLEQAIGCEFFRKRIMTEDLGLSQDEITRNYLNKEVFVEVSKINQSFARRGYLYG